MCHSSLGKCYYQCSSTPSQYGVSRALFQLQQQREATTSNQGAVSRVGQLRQLGASELCGTAVDQASRLAELHKVPHCSTGWVAVLGNMNTYASYCWNACSCPVCVLDANAPLCLTHFLVQYFEGLYSNWVCLYFSFTHLSALAYFLQMQICALHRPHWLEKQITFFFFFNFMKYAQLKYV